MGKEMSWRAGRTGLLQSGSGIQQHSLGFGCLSLNILLAARSNYAIGWSGYIQIQTCWRFHKTVKGVLCVIMLQPARWLNTNHLPDVMHLCVCVLSRWDHAVGQRSALRCWHRPGAQEAVRLPFRCRFSSSLSLMFECSFLWPFLHFTSVNSYLTSEQSNCGLKHTKVNNNTNGWF